ITLINNAGTSPAISGTFSNLATENSLLTVNATGLPGFYTFNTPGGKNTGNDLALVPPVVVSGTAGNDTFEVRRSGNGSATDTIDVLINGVLNPANIYPLTNVVSLQINGLAGSDTLLINYGGTGGLLGLG